MKNLSVKEVIELLSKEDPDAMFSVGKRKKNGTVSGKPEFTGTVVTPPGYKLVVLLQSDSWKG